MAENIPLRVIDDLFRHFWHLIRLISVGRKLRQRKRKQAVAAGDFALAEFSSDLVFSLDSSSRFRIIFLSFAFALALFVLSLLEGTSWQVYEHGEASWYGPGFFGRKTANGETLLADDFSYTAAHPSLPLGTYVLVKNQLNRRTLVVRINDRGPYINGRIIDLNHAAADQLGIKEDGIVPVTLYLRRYHLKDRP